jgi:hypothetical protein
MKPSPALQQIRQARLFRVHNQEPVGVGHVIHPGNLRHILSVIYATVQQHNERARAFRFERSRHPELEISRASNGASGPGDPFSGD